MCKPCVWIMQVCLQCMIVGSPFYATLMSTRAATYVSYSAVSYVKRMSITTLHWASFWFPDLESCKICTTQRSTHAFRTVVYRNMHNCIHSNNILLLNRWLASYLYSSLQGHDNMLSRQICHKMSRKSKNALHILSTLVSSC